MSYKLDPCRPVIGGKNEYYVLNNKVILEMKAVKKTGSWNENLNGIKSLGPCPDMKTLEKEELKIVRSHMPTYELQEILTKFIGDRTQVKKLPRKSREGYFDLSIVDRENGKSLGYVSIPDGKNVTPAAVAFHYLEGTRNLKAVEDSADVLSFETLCKEGYVDTSDYVLFTEPLAIMVGTKLAKKKNYAVLYLSYNRIVEAQGNAMPENVAKATAILEEVWNRANDTIEQVAYIATIYDGHGEAQRIINQGLVKSREYMLRTKDPVRHIGSYIDINEALLHI